jgi:hypothetical protein
MEISGLMEAAKLSGFEVYDENEYKRIVEYQLEHGQFEFLEYEDKTIGFFGWLTKDSDEGICVWINNLFVLEHYKKNFNIFDMCKFFKMKYPNIYKLEWHSQKKNKLNTLILKGRKI